MESSLCCWKRNRRSAIENDQRQGHHCPRAFHLSGCKTRPHTHEPEQATRQAVTYARDHVFERCAVEDRRDILEAALNRGMGQMTIAQVREEVASSTDRRVRCRPACWCRTAIHDHHDAAHGTRDYRPNAGRQPARLQRSLIGSTTHSYRKQRPAPGAERRTAPSGRRHLCASAGRNTSNSCLRSPGWARSASPPSDPASTSPRIGMERPA